MTFIAAGRVVFLVATRGGPLLLHLANLAGHSRALRVRFVRLHCAELSRGSFLRTIGIEASFGGRRMPWGTLGRRGAERCCCRGLSLIILNELNLVPLILLTNAI